MFALTIAIGTLGPAALAAYIWLAHRASCRYEASFRAN